jgi:O-acetyl-ADP-ribose deacetylase (regulator of RNase III)
MTSKLMNETIVTLVQGDITRQAVDAIVNAANSSLLGGGGVDGAIHRAGGPTILEQCKQIRQEQGTCAPGHAVVTTGGNLPAQFVIHTVGPIWNGGKVGEEETLANAYTNSLDLAREKGVERIAFPSISTGAYRFPVDKAAIIALRTVKDYCRTNPHFKEVRFVLFDEKTLAAYEAAMNSM